MARQNSETWQSLVDRVRPDRAPVAGRFVVAVSGGGDSVALLALLREAGWPARDLCVAHVHHGRRQEADREAEDVEALARRHEVTCRIVALPPEQAQAADPDLLRRMRLECLREVARVEDCVGLALAHTADDQRESRLLALLRGSGLTGLSGMRPWRNGIWRPLLATTRGELRGFLADRGERWHEDRSNLDFASLRARMRHVVFPAVGRALGASETLRVRILQDEDDYLRQLARAHFDRHGRRTLARDPLRALPVAMQRRVLREWLTPWKVSAERLEAFRHATIEATARSRIASFELGDGHGVLLGHDCACRVPQAVTLAGESRWADFGCLVVDAGTAKVPRILPLRDWPDADARQTWMATLKRARMAGVLREIWPGAVIEDEKVRPLPLPGGAQAVELRLGAVNIRWLPSEPGDS